MKELNAADPLVAQIRAEANHTKSCFTDFSFKAFAVGAGALGIIIAKIQENQFVALGGLAVFGLCLLVARIGNYKYSTANRNFAYELHLFRAENCYAAYRAEIRRVSWEEAMFAWRIIQATVYESIYAKSPLRGIKLGPRSNRVFEYPWYDSLALTRGSKVESNIRFENATVRAIYVSIVSAAILFFWLAISFMRFVINFGWLPDSYTFPHHNGWFVSPIALGVITFVAFRGKRDEAYQQQDFTDEKFNKNARIVESYYPGPYLRHMQSALHLMAGIGLAPLVYSVWSLPIAGDTFILWCMYFGATVLGGVFLLQRHATIRRSRQLLEHELLSIQSSAVLWRAVIIAHLRAVRCLEMRDKGYRRFTNALSFLAKDLVKNFETIHDWMEPARDEELLAEMRRELDQLDINRSPNFTAGDGI